MKTDTIVSGKEKLYKGKTLEELRKMDVREFAQLLPSRERRSVMRNFNVIENFIKKCKKDIEKNKMPKTHMRELVIVPALVGMTIGVHNGKEFVPVKIVREMLGHRLGEFSLTRKAVKHGAAGVGATRSSAALSVK